jgi:putative DNA-invertase from lambdoid prophage Rac
MAEGKKSGRTTALTDTQRAEVQAALAVGEIVSARARQYDTSRPTILRAKAGRLSTAEAGERLSECCRAP